MMDAWEAALQPREPPADAVLRRERIFQRTLPALRGAQRSRWWGRTALIGAGFAAGLLVAVGWPRPAVERTTEVARTVPPALTPLPPVRAGDLEWQALDAIEPNAELFVQAGDQYLRDGNDLSSALRCYKHALRLLSDRELVVNPSDNWLWMSLKHAKLEERTHGKREI